MTPFERLRSQCPPKVPKTYVNLVGRPVRDSEIMKDEITDLVILLNTTKSVTEFLSKL